MKKLLFGIFGTMLCVTSGYCDDVKVISPNSAYEDILDSNVRMDAVTNVIKKDPWNRLDKTKFASILRESPKLSVRAVMDACVESGVKDPDEACTEIVNWIIQEHNKLVVLSGSTGGMTEDKYNRILSFGYKCPTIRTRSVAFEDEKSCRIFCRNDAIANICSMTNYGFVEIQRVCMCNTNASLSLYEYTPSWEDYQKLMQERGQE